MLVRMVLTVILGLISTLSLAFSIFSLIHVAKYESIRIRSRDNQDSLDKYESRFKSLENRMYRYMGEGKASTTTDQLLAQLIHQQFGNGESTDDPEYAEDEYGDD